jgi:flagellar hook-associated protein 2
MGISSAGLGSGLDVNSIVSQLMALEQKPLGTLQAKAANYNAQLSAYGSLKGAVSTFQSSVAALASPSKFTAVKATVGDTATASVSAAPTASPGSYSLEVQALATNQKVKSTAFQQIGSAVGTGKITISFGTYNADTFTLNPDKASKEITIAAGQNSLTGIRDAINAANAGVTAGIVNDGSGFRLTIASKDTGVANAMRISVADDDATNIDASGLSQLAFDARTVSGTTNLTETVAARNSKVVIDGITVSKPSNTVSDAIEGLTLNLTKENTGTPTTLTVAKDTAGIQSAVSTFVKAYNDLNTTVSTLTKYDAANKKASTLTGEATVRTIQQQLRNVFALPLSNAGGGLNSLADIGISTQTDGSLKFDAAKLTAVMSDSTKDVSTLFAAIAKPTDSLIAFSASTTSTRNGSYDVKLTQVATQGKSVGSAPAALTISSGSNDALNFTVDGVSGSITLAAGTYTADSLAAEIQAKINGVKEIADGGVKVGITQSGGILTVTSSRYGSESKVSITGGSAAADIFGTPSETAGVDVAGTIGGISANGKGQTLTGTGDATGLGLKVTGGATGDRGTVKFARGYAYELQRTATDILADNGQIDNRMDGLQTTIKSLETRQTELGKRLTATEARLRAQYSTLDTMMAKMQGTSSYLSQQLASLPKIG